MVSNKRISDAVSGVAILAGVVLTVWGLLQLTWPQAVPWSIGGLHNIIIFVAICAILVIASACWSKRNPLAIGAVVAVCLALITGNIWPLLVILWIGFASILLGGRLLSALKINVEENWLINFLVGVGAYGTAIGLIAHFPVNYSGLYAVALATPILIWWRTASDYLSHLIVIFTERNEASPLNTILDSGIAVIVLVYFVVALMPELGHDALSMHLFIPAHMASRHQWGFDAGIYVWAVMPMLGDWIFTIGYMLAGETAARLINAGFILALGLLARDLVFWAGGVALGGRWATLIFFSTPLTFTEGSKLFIESVWSAFVVAGILTLFRISNSSNKAKSLVALAALLLGYAVATKAVTLTILPILVLIMIGQYRALLKETSFSSWLMAFGLFLLVGLSPYLTAWWLTGNPVFPFFNELFKSSYYPAINFDSANMFGKGLTWDILYRATFDSGKYLEAGAGASGFQWLLLFIPSLAILLIKKWGRGLTLLLVGSLVVAMVFQSVSYFRYAFPAWVILAAAIGLALGAASKESGGANKMLWVAVAFGTVLLNILFMSTGAMHRDFPLQSIWDQTQRESYLQGRLPIRNAVDLVNKLNTGESPVAVLAQPLAAGLRSDALYANWYNFRFQAEINEAIEVEKMANVLLRRDVDYIILESNWNVGSKKRDLVIEASDLIAEIGSISVRKVRSDYRFKTELLKNPDFSTIDGWSLAPGVKFDRTSGTITSNVASSATQAVPVSPGQRYLNSVIARCFKEPTLGRTQINWLDAKSQFIKADIKVFDCTRDWSEQTMDIVAPPHASVGIVYVTGQTEIPLQFKRNSLKQ